MKCIAFYFEIKKYNSVSIYSDDTAFISIGRKNKLKPIFVESGEKSSQAIHFLSHYSGL